MSQFLIPITYVETSIVKADAVIEAESLEEALAEAERLIEDGGIAYVETFEKSVIPEDSDRYELDPTSKPQEA